MIWYSPILIVTLLLPNIGNSKTTYESVIQRHLGSLDPIDAIDTSAQLVLSNSYDGLVGWNDQEGIFPQLSQNWSIEEGGRKYIFELRKDLKFSDGSRLKSRDVVAHFERVLKNSYYGVHFSAIESITEDNRGHVVLRLKYPEPDILHLLASVPARIVTKKKSEWIGAGPFTVALEKTGVRLIRNPNYWGTKSGSLEVMFRVLSETESIQAAKDSKIDDFSVYNSSGIGLDGSGAWIKTTRQMWATWAIGFDLRNPDAQVYDVRQLLSQKIKSMDWIAKFFPQAIPSYGLIPFGMPGYLDSMPILKSQNHGNKHKKNSSIQIEVPEELGNAAQISEWILDKTKDSQNIQVRVVQTPFSQIIDKLGTGKMAAFLLSFNAEYPDPGFFIRSLDPKSKSNFFGVSDPKLMEIVSIAMREGRKSHRQILYKQVNTILTEKSIVIPLMHVMHVAWFRKCATGVELSPSEGYFNFRKAKSNCE